VKPVELEGDIILQKRTGTKHEEDRANDKAEHTRNPRKDGT